MPLACLSVQRGMGTTPGAAGPPPKTRPLIVYNYRHLDTVISNDFLPFQFVETLRMKNYIFLSVTNYINLYNSKS